jgi:glutamate-1-semialdehyde 2,1-aminomutase
VTGQKLIAGIKGLAEKHGMPIVVQGYGAIFYVGFPSARAQPHDGQAIYDYRSSLAMDQNLYTDFVSAMVDRGVRIIPRGNWFLSSTHSDADIRATLDAVDAVFGDLAMKAVSA